MEWLLTSNVPNITVFDLSYFIYLIGVGLCVAIIVSKRYDISTHINRTLFIFFILAIFQRALIVFWYVYNDIYTLDNSLPLQLCRVVVWLVIIQYVVRSKVIDQLIFYLGLFALAAFIYPIGIFPFYNIAGIAFFIMHAINGLYPLAMFVAGRFVPTYTGALIASVCFTVYFILMIWINDVLNANYFFIHNRPFFHDLTLLQYSLVNILGTALSFFIVCFIVRQAINHFTKQV